MWRTILRHNGQRVPEWTFDLIPDGPDSFSRYPSSEANEADELAEDSNSSIYAIAAQEQQKQLHTRPTAVFHAASDDSVYRKLKCVIISGFPASKNQLPNCLKEFWRLKDDLTVVDDLI